MAPSAPAVPTTTSPLPGGSAMPLLGFGTWQLSDDTARASTEHALGVGYRHVDTATMYRNEAEVGRALTGSGVPRDQVFLTSKLPGSHSGDARPVLEQTLQALGVDVLDLWLVHWPADSGDVVPAWEQLLAARADGLVREVGVSNHSLEQLDTVAEATGVVPAVNQIRWSPLLFDRAVLDGHRERGVLLEGYSTLKGGTLQDPVVARIADAHGATPAQVLIAWHLAHRVVVIPRSSNPRRIEQNADVAGLVLGEDDLAALDALGG